MNGHFSSVFVGGVMAGLVCELVLPFFWSLFRPVGKPSVVGKRWVKPFK